MVKPPPSGAGQGSIHGDSVPLKTLFTKYFTAVIISLALAESIGIYGLGLFFLGGGFETLYLFNVLSAIAMFFFRPKGEEFEKLVPHSSRQV